MIEQISQILYYVNLGIAFFALMEFIALIVLCVKTAYMRAFGGVCAGAMAVGAAFAVVQLALEAMGIAGADYAVLVAFAVIVCAYVLTCAYLIVMSVRSNKKLCLAAGVLQFVPPVGAIVAVALCKKLKADTRAQRLIFTGYAYTYAACEEYCDVNKFDYMDAAGDDVPEKREKNDLKTYLKELKKNTLTPQGMYEYGMALAQYMPNKASKAYKYFSKSARSNYAPALFNLGYCFETGTLVKTDLKAARAYYKRAVAAGDKDAPMRLAILDVKSTDKKIDKSAGVKYFADNANNDNCARFNYALALERGEGVQKDMDKAIELYRECLEYGMDVARSRLFEIMCSCINTSEHDAAFKTLALVEFDGAFGLIMKAMVALKEKRTSDAADILLEAVKQRGEWEGIARLLVGTLYVDCGKTETDKRNGAAYIKTASPYTAIAEDIESALACTFKKRCKAGAATGAQNGIAAKPADAVATASGDDVTNVGDLIGGNETETNDK